MLLFIGFFAVIVSSGAVHTGSLESTLMSSSAGFVTCNLIFLLVLVVSVVSVGMLLVWSMRKKTGVFREL